MLIISALAWNFVFRGLGGAGLPTPVPMLPTPALVPVLAPVIVPGASRTPANGAAAVFSGCATHEDATQEDGLSVTHGQLNNEAHSRFRKQNTVYLAAVT